MVRGVSSDYLYNIYNFAVKSDLLFYFDINPMVSVQRRLESGRSISDYLSGGDYLPSCNDIKNLKIYYQDLSNAYKKIFKENNIKIIQINALDSIKVIHNKIIECIKEYRFC